MNYTRHFIFKWWRNEVLPGALNDHYFSEDVQMLRKTNRKMRKYLLYAYYAAKTEHEKAAIETLIKEHNHREDMFFTVIYGHPDLENHMKSIASDRNMMTKATLLFDVYMEMAETSEFKRLLNKAKKMLIKLYPLCRRLFDEKAANDV